MLKRAFYSRGSGYFKNFNDFCKGRLEAGNEFENMSFAVARGEMTIKFVSCLKAFTVKCLLDKTILTSSMHVFSTWESEAL